jgi:DNA-directed RNA polymerase specialized sigma subunit
MVKKKVDISKPQLKNLQKIFLTDTKIANNLSEKVDPSTICKLRKKYGIPKLIDNSVRNDRNKLVYSLSNQRMKNSEIAKRMNISRMTVHRILKSFK